jgi:transposase
MSICLIININIFLTEICDKVKNKLFILDNGQIHKKEETKKIIKDSGNFLLYTCPYHPRLNCIEQWFNQLKHYIKLDKPKNLIKLKESLNNSINKIKEKHYKNYFIYAYKKDIYKNTKSSHISTKHRKPKIYKK